MIRKENIIAIARKELRAFFNNPTAYVVLAVFLVLWEFLFFRTAFLVGEASLRGLFDLLPWLFLVLIPAVTMGSISTEKSEGTLEFVLTSPITDLEFILGKFLGILIFVASSFVFVLPVAAAFSRFGNLDWGIVAAQIFASLFLSAVFISLGIFVSSFFQSPISSFLVSALICFILVAIGFDLFTAILPSNLTVVLERISVFSHFQSVSRGVLDVRDVWYFVSLSSVFFALTLLQFYKRRYGNRKHSFRTFQAGTLLFIGIVVLTNILGEKIPGRLDLTGEKIFTPSEITRNTLSNLKDVLNVTLYTSSQLPSQLQPVVRQTKDLLSDYQNLGKGKVLVLYKNASDPQVSQEAKSLGVREVQFNVLSREEFQVKSGYLGLTLSYGGQNEVIPFISDTSDLEYQLTSLVRKLTVTNKKKIAFLEGNGEKSPSFDYKVLSEELKKQFEIKEVVDDEKNPVSLKDYSAVVIAGPKQKISQKTRDEIKSYLASGGSALFLIDSISIEPQTLVGSVNSESFSDFLKDYGINIQQDIVYDLRSNETVRFGGGLLTYLLPYPFWVKVVAADKDSPILSKIESLVLPWPSSISPDESKIKENGFDFKKLLTTSQFGGKVSDNFSVSPDRNLPNSNLGDQLVGIQLQSKEIKEGKKTNIIVISNSDFLTDQFVSNSSQNLAFGTSALSFLTQEESLSSISLKQKAVRSLYFQNDFEIVAVKYGNMALAVISITGMGIFRILRRRNLSATSYKASV